MGEGREGGGWEGVGGEERRGEEWGGVGGMEGGWMDGREREAGREESGL